MDDTPLTSERLLNLLFKSINNLDVDEARREVEPFVKNPENWFIWSHEFFSDVASRIKNIRKDEV